LFPKVRKRLLSNGLVANKGISSAYITK